MPIQKPPPIITPIAEFIKFYLPVPCPSNSFMFLEATTIHQRLKQKTFINHFLYKSRNPEMFLNQTLTMPYIFGSSVILFGNDPIPLPTP